MAISSGGESSEVELVKCHCCGLTEECTVVYIARVRERYQGRWICGLCSEAVKDELYRSPKETSTDEALKRHVKFYEQFRSSSPPDNPAEELIVAMKQLLRRSLDAPDKKGILRSQSCFPRISGTKKE